MSARAKQMTAQQRAAARFFVRVEQHGRATHRCEHTLPLIPLLLILDADGTLTAGMREAPRRYQA